MTMRLLLHSCLSVLLTDPVQASLQYVTSPNGFDNPARGWNSWALQADDHQIELNEKTVVEQCGKMASIMNTLHLNHNFTICSLDSGWSVDHGDKYGRIINDESKFPSMTALASTLHGMGLELGIYIKPGFFVTDLNKTIKGTDIKFSEIVYEKDKYLFEHRYSIDYNAKGAQEYCNSNIDQFAEWGVDYIKLDHVTPGTKGTGLPHNNSGIAVCYHRAIKNNGRKIRLALSPKLDLSHEYYKIWSMSADSMRLAGDVNHVPQHGNDSSVLVEWPKIQRTFAYLRAFLRSRGTNEKLTIRPDLDPLLMGNGGVLNGLTSSQRLTTLAHYVVAGSNILLGSDMTKLDDFGMEWLTNSHIWNIADFSAQHPVRPVGIYEEKAPSHGIKGEQIQAYVAGPNDMGEGLLMVANYGDSGDNNYYIKSYKGTVTYKITEDLLKPSGLTHGCYTFQNILSKESIILQGATGVDVALDDSETALYLMTPERAGCDAHDGEL